MLDYSHHVGIERNSLFYLQWMYINPYIVSGKPESDTKSRGKEEVLNIKVQVKKKNDNCFLITIKEDCKIL